MATKNKRSSSESGNTTRSNSGNGNRGKNLKRSVSQSIAQRTRRGRNFNSSTGYWILGGLSAIAAIVYGIRRYRQGDLHLDFLDSERDRNAEYAE